MTLGRRGELRIACSGRPSLPRKRAGVGRTQPYPLASCPIGANIVGVDSSQPPIRRLRISMSAAPDADQVPRSGPLASSPSRSRSLHWGLDHVPVSLPHSL